MTPKINEALDLLKTIICAELSEEVSLFRITMTADDVTMKCVSHTPEQLRKRNVSMRNIKGEWIVEKNRREKNK